MPVQYQATVSSFVPGIILERVLAMSGSLEEPGEALADAGVLFVDISGFTALTERLSARGPEGAEELTRLLNRYFGDVIDEIEGAGGDVLKFAGDALLAVWPTSAAVPTLNEAVDRICDVSERLQAAMHDQEVAPGVRLSMKLAVGAGQIKVAHLGGVFDRWEFLVSGTPLAQLGRANDVAESGQIVLSEEAHRLLNPARTTRELAPGVMCLIPAASITPASEVRPLSPGLTGPQVEQVLTFLPAAIRGRVAAGYADWLCELRPISVVFLNLPGFGADTPLDRAQVAMRTLQTTLYRFEGSINKMSVDDKGVSLIAVLGLPPLSHTDDPERAIRAALDMQTDLSALHFASSVGVCTGLAFCGVVGNDRRREYTVMGDVVNLSARLMQAAAGGVLCDLTTRRSAGDRISFEALDPMPIKGKAHLIEVFRPTGNLVANLGSDNERVPQGRGQERLRIATLVDTVLSGAQGPAQRLCISADGGLGKWTLVREMLARATEAGVSTLVAVGDPLDHSTPFLAWRTVVSTILGLNDAEHEDLEDRAWLVERLPSRHAREFAPLLADVVSVSLDDNELTAGLIGETRREHTLQLLTEIISAHVTLRPCVLSVKDAHLMDESSWALLAQIDGASRTTPIVATRRKSHGELGASARAWLDASRTEHITLDVLGDDMLEALALQRLGAARMTPEVRDLLVGRSMGNPLYCEELIVALRESGGLHVADGVGRLSDESGVTPAQVPASLQGLLSARIDRLGAQAQVTLKAASVVGSPFSLEVVGHIHPRQPDMAELSREIRSFIDAELIEPVRMGVTAQFGRAPYYQFKKELIREVTYDLMLFAQRRSLHRATANWIESELGDELAIHYAVLGRHWAKTVDEREPDVVATRRAADYLERAGNRALRGFANAEAIELYREALTCVAMTRHTDGYERAELGLLLKLGAPLMSTRNYADPEVNAVYDRARALGESTGASAELFGAIRGLWQGAVGRSDYAKAIELADELVVHAQKMNGETERIEAYRAVGSSAFWPGELVRARESMESAFRLAARQPDAPLPEGVTQDPDIANRGLLAWTLATLGFGASALGHIDTARDRGMALKHPFSMAYASGAEMWTHFILRNVDAAYAAAENTAVLSEEHGIPYFLVASHAVREWALATRGDTGAPDRLALELDEWRSNTGGIGMAIFLYTQAEALAHQERYSDALLVLDDPTLVERLSIEQWYLPDVLRLRAECEWHLGRREGAAANLSSSRRLSMAQQSRLAALRLSAFEAMTLGREQDWSALCVAVASMPEDFLSGSLTLARGILTAGPQDS